MDNREILRSLSYIILLLEEPYAIGFTRGDADEELKKELSSLAFRVSGPVTQEYVRKKEEQR